MLELIKESDGLVILEHSSDGISAIGTKFNSNTVITSFMELQYFTGSVAYDNTHYYYAGQTNNGTMFYNCTALRKVKIPEGVTVMLNTFRNCRSLQLVDLPSSVTRTGNYIWSNTPAKCVICRASTPPSFTQGDVYGALNPTLGIYVPDDSVAVYKATSRWSEFANRIKPLSQFDVDYPNGFT